MFAFSSCIIDSFEISDWLEPECFLMYFMSATIAFFYRISENDPKDLKLINLIVFI